MDAICYIAGAGSWYDDTFLPQSGDCVIAADGGLAYLIKRGIRADLTIGDFDSGARPDVGNVIAFPPEKDDTDMLLAVKAGYSRGYRRFLLYGATGGNRFDHTLANLQVLVWLARHGASAWMMERETAITALHERDIVFPAAFFGGISVFCAGERAESVTLRGLKYPLEDGVLTCDYPLGVSNEFTGCEAHISVGHGTLLLTVSRKNEKERFPWG